MDEKENPFEKNASLLHACRRILRKYSIESFGDQRKLYLTRIRLEVLAGRIVLTPAESEIFYKVVELQNDVATFYLPLAKALARRQLHQSHFKVEQDDLVQEGMTALMNGLFAYNKNKSAPDTYAWHCMTRQMWKYRLSKRSVVSKDLTKIVADGLIDEKSDAQKRIEQLDVISNILKEVEFTEVEQQVLGFIMRGEYNCAVIGRSMKNRITESNYTRAGIKEIYGRIIKKIKGQFRRTSAAA